MRHLQQRPHRTQESGLAAPLPCIPACLSPTCCAPDTPGGLATHVLTALVHGATRPEWQQLGQEWSRAGRLLPVWGEQKGRGVAANPCGTIGPGRVLRGGTPAL